MRLSEKMATVHFVGHRPWTDAPSDYGSNRFNNRKQTEKRKSAASLANERRRQAAIDEVHKLLSDLQWHSKHEIAEIVMRHGIVGINSVIDNAGGYPESGWVISARADL